MKRQIITLALSLLFLKSHAQYHVNVRHFSDGIYYVEYTNNNWYTKDKIMAYNQYYQTFDTQMFIEYKDAVSFAKKMSTFKKAKAYNTNQKKRYERNKPVIHPLTSIY